MFLWSTVTILYVLGTPLSFRLLYVFVFSYSTKYLIPEIVRRQINFDFGIVEEYCVVSEMYEAIQKYFFKQYKGLVSIMSRLCLGTLPKREE